MARFLYGGGGDGDVIKPAGTPFINTTALVYNSRSGGSQITDLQNISGTSISQVTTDSVGQAIFFGPDNYIGVLWLDFGAGSPVRWAVSPKAVDLAANRAIAVQRAADAATPSFTAKAHLPYNTADPLEQALTTALDPMVIPRFATSAARDAAFPAPTAGDRCYRTDIKSEQLYNGTTWISSGLSQTWTMSLAASTTSPTNLTLAGSYTQVNKQVNGMFSILFGATSTAGTGTYQNFALPVTGARPVDGIEIAIGTFTAVFASNTYNGLVIVGTGTSTFTNVARFRFSDVAGAGSSSWSATSPAAPASGNYVSGTFTYTAV